MTGKKFTQVMPSGIRTFPRNGGENSVFALNGARGGRRKRIFQTGGNDGRFDYRRRRQQRRPKDDVLQFPDIAGPAVAFQQGQGRWRKFFRTAVSGPGFEEMTRQNRYIFIPFPQGRNMYGKDIQTMKEILAETSLSDGLTEIPV